jgi:hypothetical protein
MRFPIVLLRMFRPEVHGTDIATHVPALMLEQPMTLKSRLGAVRRRRRLASLKRLLAVGPAFVGLALLILAAFGAIAGFR